jgi:DNA polymerase-3 subunit delta'
VVRAAGYHRYSARQRFVIIDPAEAMLPAAANALLKTLEEPPEGTGFFLIATHGSALLPTIRSRCQRIRFGALSDEVLVPWLAAQQVAQPALVARLAGGCPGLALDLAQGGLDKRLELRTRLLAALGGSLDSIFGLSEDICTGSRAVWMKSAEALLDLLEDLVRDAVVLAADGDVQPIHTDIPEVISAWSSALWPNGIERCERAIQATRADLALNVTGKTALDALLTRIATELGPARKAGVPRA